MGSIKSADGRIVSMPHLKVQPGPSLRDLCANMGIKMSQPPAGCHWQRVDWESVSPLKRIRAAGAAAKAARDLHVGPIEVAFVEPATAATADVTVDRSMANAKGFVVGRKTGEPYRMFLRTSLAEDDVVPTVGHEVRHLWHASWGAENRPSEADEERDCERWALAFAEDY